MRECLEPKKGLKWEGVERKPKLGTPLGFRQLTLLVLSECVADVNNNKDSEAVKDVFHQ